MAEPDATKIEPGVYGEAVYSELLIESEVYGEGVIMDPIPDPAAPIQVIFLGSKL